MVVVLSKQERLWEVDLLRGVAVLMMLLSNFIFDLSFFSYMQTPLTGVWPWFARLTAGLFLVVAGISLTISSASPLARQVGLFKVVKRGGRIFALGLLISLATWYAVGEQFVIFGILHLIGLGLIMAYPFLGRRYLSLLGGIVVVTGGCLVKKIEVSHPWLLWLGVQHEGFASVDYTPVLPWFGFILLGMFVGESCFPEGRRRLIFPSPERAPLLRITGMLGRHSLIIYFVHQPIFWSGFWLLQVLRGS